MHYMLPVMNMNGIYKYVKGSWIDKQLTMQKILGAPSIFSLPADLGSFAWSLVGEPVERSARRAHLDPSWSEPPEGFCGRGLGLGQHAADRAMHIPTA